MCASRSWEGQGYLSTAVHRDSKRPFPWFIPNAALHQGVCSSRQTAAGTCKIPWGVLSAQNNATAGMDDFLSHLTFTPPPPSHPYTLIFPYTRK